MTRKITTAFKAIILLSLACTTMGSYAQNQTIVNQQKRIPTPTMQFLTITPDARAAGMGDAGVAISNDANAMYWNPAKLATNEKDLAVSLSYTPWLRNLINDMALINLGGYKKIGKGQAVSFGINYFDLGSWQNTTVAGELVQTYNSKEFAITAGYSRVLSKHLSLGVNLKFLNSNLLGNYQGQNGTPSKTPSTVAADIALFYDAHRDRPWNYTYGLNISNISGKVNYGGADDNFIPTNFRLGMGATHTIDKHNKLTFTADINKLMVPTPPIYENGKIVKGTDPRTTSSIGGMFSSFGDAPDGFSEELKEITVSLGAEYLYNETLAFRTGYFNESEDKGGRKYFTLGAGFNYEKKYAIDFAYLVPTGSGSPLANTLRLSLHAFFDGKGKPTSDEAETIKTKK